MKLVASMNCKDEFSRYLAPVVTHLLTWCDEVRVQDDGSTDGSFEWLQEQDRVVVKRNAGPTWSTNEGLLHQSLLDFTLEAKPTHIIAIDADEIVPRGALIRAVVSVLPDRAYMLRMCEIWKRDSDPWQVRVDGGWRPHPVAILYRLPNQRDLGPDWNIWGRKMAGGRVPRIIRADQRRGNAYDLGLDILHLGWSRPEERQARYARYAELDGGRFHAKAHLDSILLPDSKIGLEPYPVPAGIPAFE